MSRFICPAGTSENSPAFQRRVSRQRTEPRPGGTPEPAAYFLRISIVPTARDSEHPRSHPPVKLAGYYRSSLWDCLPKNGLGSRSYSLPTPSASATRLM